MPSAIKHDHELSSKGLVSVLVHSQQATPDELQAFLLKTFPDNDCFVTPSAFVPTPASTGIPHAALIGVDGKLLWDGHPLGEPKKIQELIDAELLKVKKGWGETSEARKVRASLYGKNDLGGAAALIAALADGEEKTALQGELDRRYATQKKSITELQNQGRWLDSQAACKALLKDVGTKAAAEAQQAATKAGEKVIDAAAQGVKAGVQQAVGGQPPAQPAPAPAAKPPAKP